jgi:hypothetical protein
LVDDQGNIIPKNLEAALVAAQAYLHTTRPNPGDPREHMHRAALNGLKMVGNKLSSKEEEAYRSKGTHKPMQGHHAVTTVIGIEVEVDDPGRRHQNGTTIQRIKELDDPELLIKHATIKTMRRRWGRHALPVGFVSRQYPKVSNYCMTSKSTTDLRSHSHGFQTTCKQ